MICSKKLRIIFYACV